MTVLGELLSELKPGQEQPDALELLQELHVTCQSMQERLVDLISKLSNDEITAELLRINDDMNNLFLRYSRWENNREAGGQSASSILARSVPPPPVAAKASDSLIDLEGPDDVATQLSKLGRYILLMCVMTSQTNFKQNKSFRYLRMSLRIFALSIVISWFGVVVFRRYFLKCISFIKTTYL